MILRQDGSFAGSQPRSFISFRLGEISNDQPAQTAEESMETDQIGVDVTELGSNQTEEAIEVFEITLSSTEPEERAEDNLPEQTATPVQQPSPQVKREAECISLLAEMYRIGGFVFSSSGSDESVGAYCTRKNEAMSPDKVQSELAESRLTPKASYSDAIRLAPVGQSVGTSAQVEEPTEDDLALTTPQLHPNIQSLGQGSKFPKSKVNIETPAIEFAFSPAQEHQVLNGGSASGRVDSTSNVMSGGEEFMSTGEIEELATTDLESEHYKRSTLADAIAAPVHNFAPRFSEGSEYVSPDEVIQRSGGPAPLSIHSQELIRTDFEKAHSFSLPQGHPTISLNQEQIGHILRIVADVEQCSDPCQPAEHSRFAYHEENADASTHVSALMYDWI